VSGPVLRRGLFWRVYGTLLAGLVLAALLGAVVWHTVAERPVRPTPPLPGRAVAALLPRADASAVETEAALRRMSTALDGGVALRGPDGRTLVAAERGRVVPAGARPEPRRAFWFATHDAISRWRIDLGDGRTLAIDAPARGRHGPPDLVVLLAVAGAVGLAAFPVVSRITRRLERLRASMETWGEGRLGARAQVEGGDEIASVAASFNAAADRVEGLLAAHRTLLAHASHELRSPLARLRMATELLVADPRPELVHSVTRDIAELDALVDEILLASRLDHETAPEMDEAVDLLALAAEEAARAGAQVRPVTAGPFEVPGSARLLRRLIRNLIDNALKHGGAAVEVEVDRLAAADGPRVTVAVHDRGPGIPAAERERVFEPFYRPAGRAEAAGSWGLGLSLVRQIAERHGGSVGCTDRPGGGASFVAELPARAGGPA
jgi:signal transduction histidine kinase